MPMQPRQPDSHASDDGDDRPYDDFLRALFMRALSETLRQHPATHFPVASNSIVLPLNGTCTGTLAAFMKVSVFEPATTLPPLVPTSFAWEGMTALGLTGR
jgi:hypothetical protein